MWRETKGFELRKMMQLVTLQGIEPETKPNKWTSGDSNKQTYPYGCTVLDSNSLEERKKRPLPDTLPLVGNTLRQFDGSDPGFFVLATS
jgi:hypothetical protein